MRLWLTTNIVNPSWTYRILSTLHRLKNLKKKNNNNKTITRYMPSTALNNDIMYFFIARKRRHCAPGRPIWTPHNILQITFTSRYWSFGTVCARHLSPLPGTSTENASNVISDRIVSAIYFFFLCKYDNYDYFN